MSCFTTVQTPWKIWLGLLLPAAALLATDLAHAQELDEIVVTAQRRVENIQSVPVAVTAFAGEKLAEQNIIRVDDLASRVPGLFITSGNSVGTTRMNIRGVFSEPNNVGLGNSIPNYMDGTALGPGRTIDSGLYDLAAIEVLRGPQGTLFGRNSTGGAILVRTNQPTLDGFKAAGDVAFGNYSAKRLRAAVNIPVSDSAAIRIAGDYEKRDGFVKNITQNIRQNDQDSKGFRLQALFNLNEAWRLTLRGDWSHDKQNANVKDFASNASGGQYNLAAQDFVVATDQPSLTERKTRSAAAEVVHDTGGIRFVSLTSYAWFDYANQDDVDYTSTNAFNTFALVQQHQWSQEFRFESPEKDRLSWVGGLYFFTEDVATQNSFYGLFGTFVGQTATTRISIGSGTRKTDSLAAFGQARWRVTDKVSLIGGLRYTKEDSDVVKFQAPGLGALGIAALNSAVSTSDGELTGTAKLQYEPSDTLMLYAGFTRGFKASGFNLAPGGPSDYIADPEYVSAFEAGLRSELLDRRLRLNATVFNYKYRDLQRSTFVIPPGSTVPTLVFGNAGKVDSKGIELEAEYAPIKSLTVGATFGYTDAKFKELIELVGTTRVDRSGNIPSRTPKKTISTFFQYLYPGFSTVDVSFRADYQYRDDSYSTDANTIDRRIENVSLGNLRLGVQSKTGPWNIAAYVKNVGDARYNLDVVPATGLVAGIGLQMGPPRTYGLEFGLRY